MDVDKATELQPDPEGDELDGEVGVGNEEQEDDSAASASVTDEDLRTLGVLKEHAGGYSAEELIRLANDGLEATQRRREEEKRMWEEREAEKARVKTAKTAQSDDDGDATGDDLISRAEAARLVDERLQRIQTERTHEEMVARHGLTADESFFVRYAVEGALADPRNKGATLEAAYEYVLTQVLKKSGSPVPATKKEGGGNTTKEAIRDSVRVNRARPAVSGRMGGGASTSVPSGGGPPPWDDPNKPGWDLFSDERLEHLKEELGV